MRPRGLEPPRTIQSTRPSTLGVYQFRHRRVGGEYSPEPALALAVSSGGGPVPSVNRARFTNTRSTAANRRLTRKREQTNGPDQATAGDLRLHQALLGGERISAD